MEQTYLHQVAAGAVLDRDVSGGHESLVDLRVHVDREVLLRHEFLVSPVTHSIDPRLEWCPDDGEDYVGDVGSRQLLHFSWLSWQSLCHDWKVPRMVEHRLDGKSLEVWYLNRLHRRCWDPSSL